MRRARAQIGRGGGATGDHPRQPRPLMNTQTPTPAIADLAPPISTWRMDAVFPDARQDPPEDTGVGAVTAPSTAAGAMTSRSRYTRLVVNPS
jgi:hypothetical protein